MAWRKLYARDELGDPIAGATCWPDLSSLFDSYDLKLVPSKKIPDAISGQARGSIPFRPTMLCSQIRLDTFLKVY